MAEVWLAHCVGASGFRRLVAIKRPLPSFRDDDELQRLMIAEARVGGRVHHRNLVAVVGLGLEDGSYYVVMEYVDGLDLARLAQGRVEPAVAVHIVGEVLLGLDYLHRLCDDAGRPLGLVHRDVSPSNVLVSRSGEIKLADYGIAKATVLAGNTAANIRRGKYGYMSPEQVVGGRLDARSDQFAAAVMLVELLTGRRPFDGAGPAQVMDRIAEASEPRLEGVPPGLVGVVRRALAREADRRFAGARELRDAMIAAVPRATGVGLRGMAAWVRSSPLSR